MPMPLMCVAQVGIGGLGGFDMLNKVAYSIETDDSEYFDECTEFFDDIDAKLDTMQERWEQEMKTRIKKRISQAVAKPIDLTGVTRCHAAAAIPMTKGVVVGRGVRRSQSDSSRTNSEAKATVARPWRPCS